MKRKIAMMMAMSMVFTSLPMNGFTVWAEEEYAMDEIVEEEVSDELDTGLEQSILAASENTGGIENQPKMWDGEILIESISELEQFEDIVTADPTVKAGNEATESDLTVANPDTILVDPGETAVMTVNASAKNPLTYKWFNKMGDELTSETGSSCTLSNVQESTMYSCEVSDGLATRTIYFHVKVDTGLDFDWSQMTENYENLERGTDITLEPAVLVKEEFALSYEWVIWQGGWVTIEGARSKSYTVTNIQAPQTLQCRVSDEYGNTIGIEYNLKLKDDTLTVDYEQTVTNLNVEPNETVILAVMARSELGSETLTYQWYTEDGITEINGASSSSYTVEGVTAAAQYVCKVSDGTETESVTFYISVDSGLTVKQDNETTVIVGGGKTLQVEASNKTGKLQYRWYRYMNGEETVLEGQISETLVLENVRENATYYCDVSDDYNSKRATFRINVVSDLDYQVLTQNNFKVPLGGAVKMAVSATSSVGPVTYEWYQCPISGGAGEQKIEDAAASSLDISNIQNSTVYSCKISDGLAVEQVDFVVKIDTGLEIDIYDPTPTYYSDLEYGQDIQLKAAVTVQEGFTLHYQWSVLQWTESGESWNDIEGAQHQFYTVTNIQSAQNLRCVVTDDYGNDVCIQFYVAPTNDTLSIDYDNILTNFCIEPNSGVTFEVKAESKLGSEKLTYAWYTEGGTPITDASMAFYTVSNVTEEGKYYCVVSDGNETETVWFQISIDSGLSVEKYNDITVRPGNSVTLQAEATNKTGNLKYQWYQYKDCQEIKLEGQNAETLVLDNVTEEATYYCYVSDDYDIVCAEFYIYVETDLDYSRLTPTDFTVQLGETVTMAVSATSSLGPITYEWYRSPRLGDSNWQRIDSENGSSLTITADKSMTYECRMKDSYDSRSAYFNVTIDSGFRIINMSGEWSDDYEANVVEIQPNGSCSLTVEATSLIGTLMWDWYQVGEDDDIELSAGSTLNLENIDSSGRYYCIISDGYQRSYEYFYIVFDTGFSAAADERVEADEDGTAVLSVSAFTQEAYGPLKYQWEQYLPDNDDFSILEENGSDLTVTGVTEVQLFRCTISDRWNYKKLIITVVPNGNSDPQHADFKDALEIGEGTAVTAIVEAPYTSVFFRFVPQKSGVYRIVSLDPKDRDTVGELYDANQVLLASNDDGENDLNFEIQYDMWAGRTYYITTRFLSETRIGEFPVLITYEGPSESNEHLWDEGTVTQPATCTEAGVKTFTCTRHGETYTEPIEALGHNYPEEWTELNPATCTQEGSKYRICERCGSVETQTIAMLEHTFEDQKDIPATETTNGKKYQLCKICQTENILKIIPATGVSAKAEEVQDVLNNLKSEGPTATVADAVTKVTEIDNKAMIEIQENTSAEETGLMDLVLDLEKMLIGAETTGITGTIAESGVKTEAESGETVVADHVSVEGAAVTVASVLQNQAKAEKPLFTPDADAAYHAQIEVTETTVTETNAYAIDISLNIIKTKEGPSEPVATGVQPAAPIRITIPVPVQLQGASFKLYHIPDGKTEAEKEELSYQLSADGTTLSFYAASLSIHMLSLEKCAEGQHDYIEDNEYDGKKAPTCMAEGKQKLVCSKCKDEQIVILDKKQHNWTDWEVTAATCTAKGSKTRSCKNADCSATETVELSILGHAMKYVVDKEPTCIETGLQHGVCPRCKAEEDQKEIPPTGKHNMVMVVDKAATCGATGIQHRECAVCHLKESAISIPATGNHNMVNVVDKAAACSAPGSQHKECSVCHTKDTATAIPATGSHSFGDYTTVQSATVLAEGKETKTCKVCGYSISRTLPRLSGTIKLTATKIPLQLKKTVDMNKLVTGMVAGDYVVSWKSSNTKIASVKGSKVTGKKAGKAVLTVTLASGVSAKVTVTVQKTAVKTTKITNVAKKLTMKRGEKATLKPVISPITSLEKVTYTSSNKKIVTVSSKGVIQAKASGTAKVTVKSGSKKVTISIVVQKTPPTKISGIPSSKTLKKGKSLTLKPKLLPAGSEAKVTFKTSNKKVATVDSKGKVTAKGKGTTVITVKAGSVQAQCKITVK